MAIRPSDRLAPFTTAELTIVGAGLGATIADTLDAALRDEIAADNRQAAGRTLLLAASLSLEIDDHLGEPHPPLSYFAATAQMIADGSYAEEMRGVLLAALAEDEGSMAALEGMEAAAGESNVIHLPSSVDRRGDAA